MTARPAGHVLLNDGLLFFHRQMIHVPGGRSRELSPIDAAILDCLVRGESEIWLLGKRLVELGFGGDAESVIQGLLLSLSDPSSLLQLLPPVTTVEPQVVVCDLGSTEPGESARNLVRTLRRRHSVFCIDGSEASEGQPLRRLGVKSPAARGKIGSWFLVAQWVRSFVRCHPDALLVCVGPVDTAVLGDLALAVPMAVLLDPSWPSPCGVMDLLGDRWLPEDPIESIRAMFYALRFQGPDELKSLHRNNSSDLAILEEFALKYADTVFFSRADQAGQLSLRRKPGGQTHPTGIKRPFSAGTAPQQSILLAANLEEGLGPLIPFLSRLQAATEQLAIREILILGSGGWHRLSLGHTRVAVAPLATKPPGRDAILAAFLLPGLLRDLQPALRAAASVPCLLVPTMRSHPLLQDAPLDWILTDSTPSGMVASLRALADPDARKRRLAGQRVWLRRFDPGIVLGDALASAGSHAPK